jgi:hypothetical protein
MKPFCMMLIGLKEWTTPTSKASKKKKKVDEYDDDDYQDQDDNVVTEEILFANPNQPHEQDHMKEAPVDDDHGEPPAVQLQRTGRARLQRIQTRTRVRTGNNKPTVKWREIKSKE